MAKIILTAAKQAMLDTGMFLAGGASGMDGTAAQLNGTNGGAAAGLALHYSNLVAVAGVPVQLDIAVYGSQGGLGGSGAQGANGAQVSAAPDFAPGQSGGSGGAGGAGTAVSSTLNTVTIGSGAQPWVDPAPNVTVMTYGSSGGWGGYGGDGGSGGFSTVGMGPSGLVPVGQGAAAGSGGAGGAGGDGFAASSTVKTLVAVENTSSTSNFSAIALGGSGGLGEGGGNGGNGGGAGAGGAGGAGGNGGAALAVWDNSSVVQLGSGEVQFALSARGGTGGKGGAGGGAGYGITEYLVPGLLNQFVGGAGGAGGTGGNGGAATADFMSNTITATSNADIALEISVTPGLGSVGGAGGSGGQTGIYGNTQYTAGADGANGANGANGRAIIQIIGNSITVGNNGTFSLGISPATNGLVLNFSAKASGQDQLTFLRNTLTGGGASSLDLSQVHGASAVVDVAGGHLSLAGGGPNTMSGFATFTGTANGGDTFLDGGGNQVYQIGTAPSTAPDKLVFTGNNGNDLVLGVDQSGVLIDLHHIAGFANFAAVQAATTYSYNSALGEQVATIQIDAHDSIEVATSHLLQASWFSFN